MSDASLFRRVSKKWRSKRNSGPNSKGDSHNDTPKLDPSRKASAETNTPKVQSELFEADAIEDADAEPTLLAEVGRLVVALKRAYPEPKNTWYERTYARIKSVTNYIGIPGLIIAAIFPVYNLVDASVNYLNNEFVHSVYTAYAMELLEQGEIERADQVIADLEYADKHDIYRLKWVVQTDDVDSIGGEVARWSARRLPWLDIGLRFLWLSTSDIGVLRA